jgi:hypothetical protein
VNGRAMSASIRSRLINSRRLIGFRQGALRIRRKNGVLMTEMGPNSVIRRCRLNVRITPKSGHVADIPDRQVRATNGHSDQLNC